MGNLGLSWGGELLWLREGGGCSCSSGGAGVTVRVAPECSDREVSLTWTHRQTDRWTHTHTDIWTRTHGMGQFRHNLL